MRNIALLIEYDGTSYHGWQIQKNGKSIQDILQETIGSLLQEDVKLVGAGRTDAGVHARGQVANFVTGANWNTSKLVCALNGKLPSDIAIKDAADVNADFHSRFDAMSRKYVYRISKRKSPLERNYTAFMPFDLCIDEMNSVSESLAGVRSFKAFTKCATHVAQPEEEDGFMCRVYSARWSATPNGSEFTIEANRFLHGMVRAIVGAMVNIGRGKLASDGFTLIMKSGDRRCAPMSAPARGLCLEEVKYPFDIWGVNDEK